MLDLAVTNLKRSLALIDPTNWAGRELDVAGDVLTVAELAELFGRVSGRTVKHEQTYWEAETANVGEEVIRLMRWVEREGLRVDVAALRNRYPWLTDLETYLRTHDWAIQKADSKGAK